MSKSGGDYIVLPVMKALQVLDYVARQGHDVTLTETVQELKLPKTTVFRYLQTLSAAQFLEHDLKRDRYGVGSKFRSLARVDQELQGLRDIAQPEMRTLMETFHETVNLAVLSENEVVYIDMLEPGRPLRANARIGHRHPAHSTSLGKAMMAFLPDADALALSSELPQRTINTLTDADKLRRQVDDVRRRGYAIEVGENEDGLMCIGVPILDRTGYPVAAMSLSAPERRMKPELTMVAADALKGAAKRISTHLSAQH
ncbi:transcriptional regulator [Devosia sp. Root413D1]|jgi:IclR family transcriptional regulator, KDG regulon repressor|uniref:IclR family transcriptional regulator n=1 Tax=unclassified Devosia TaxID=196773 RepID=UPI0006F6B85A|nr:MULTISPECIES: IclR family transcriptional regulator [unclassified Devosia]KQW78034.1 transcriptional regulator [Devosia sp. Root413D1]MBN9363292.1 IclR family transcriptional regulator [Devosia sp.]ODS83734.1 MAG: transcriptional regulator [Devosia sp. SCN 66-27]OJX25131.1 MAG: transcriptional regulator [Devosia sp. 66-14]